MYTVLISMYIIKKNILNNYINKIYTYTILHFEPMGHTNLVCEAIFIISHTALGEVNIFDFIVIL